MKFWRVPVVYEVVGTVDIEADTLEEAMDIALNDPDVGFPDTNDVEYVGGSWSLWEEDVENVREFYNDGEPDDAEEDGDGANGTAAPESPATYEFVYMPSEAVCFSFEEEKEEERDPDEMFGFLFSKEDA